MNGNLTLSKTKYNTMLLNKLHSKELGQEDVQSIVNDFNALNLPKAFVVVAEQLVHLVFINMTLRGVGHAIQYIPDVIWNYESVTGTWTCTKDRTGVFESLSPFKHGGSPFAGTTAGK